MNRQHEEFGGSVKSGMMARALAMAKENWKKNSCTNCKHIIDEDQYLPGFVTSGPTCEFGGAASGTCERYEADVEKQERLEAFMLQYMQDNMQEEEGEDVTMRAEAAAKTLKEMVELWREFGRKAVGIDFEQAQAVQKGIEALEKQFPMVVKEVHVDEYYCPACGAENGCDQKKVTDKFCPVCGQALRVTMDEY